MELCYVEMNCDPCHLQPCRDDQLCELCIGQSCGYNAVCYWWADHCADVCNYYYDYHMRKLIDCDVITSSATNDSAAP